MTRTPLPRPLLVTATVAPVLIAALTGCNATSSSASASHRPGYHRSTHQPTQSSPAATSTPTAAAPASAGTRAYAVYYVGDGPARPVLYREFHSGPVVPATDTTGGGNDLLTAAVRDALQATPLDPDYRSAWRGRATLGSAALAGTGDGVKVDLSGASLTTRPAGASGAEARAAVQQLVYTAQGAIGKRVPVTFTVGHKAVGTLLGVDVSRPVAAGRLLATLSTMTISNPNEGTHVSGDTLRVTGANNGFEGTVHLRLMQGRKVVLEQPGIGGFMGNQLYPWSITLDLSQVAPGAYRLVASNDDPSGGEGSGPATDTRSIVIS